jgi:DNA primase
VASVDGRAKLVELARPLIQRIPSEVYRELLTAQLASVVGMPASRLNELIAASPNGGASPPSDGSRRSVPPRPSAGPGLAGRGNLVRQAVSLLVHHPAAATAPVDLEALSMVERPGVPLLLELLTQLREDPAANQAVLLERWRDRPEHGSLSKLAMTECLVSEPAAAAAELGSAIARLIAEDTPSRRLDQLLARARETVLSDPEKQELQALLRARGGAGQPVK